MQPLFEAGVSASVTRILNVHPLMPPLMKVRFCSCFSAAALLVLPMTGHADSHPLPPGVTRVPAEISGGHDTDPRDGSGGRPVILIAAALGVTSDVFREAFSHVRPAHRDGGPTGDEARTNKAALMNALGKYGITNDRLDEVSNYYRYRRDKGQMWPNRAATVNALVKDGAVVGYEVVDGGAGYSSPPTVTVANAKGAPAKVEVSYGKELKTNGAISSVTPADAKR